MARRSGSGSAWPGRCSASHSSTTAPPSRAATSWRRTRITTGSPSRRPTPRGGSSSMRCLPGRSSSSWSRGTASVGPRASSCLPGRPGRSPSKSSRRPRPPGASWTRRPAPRFPRAVVRTLAPSKGDYIERFVLTGDDGRFVLQGVHSGGIFVHADGYGEVARSFPPMQPPDGYVIELSPAMSFTGRVVDAKWEAGRRRQGPRSPPAGEAGTLQQGTVHPRGRDLLDHLGLLPSGGIAGRAAGRGAPIHHWGSPSRSTSLREGVVTE